MIAYCGLHCIKCPIYLSTREKDREKQKRMREDIVRQILKAYGVQCRVEDITDCDGCTTPKGRLFGGCRRKCKIRPCAREKGLENCAHCNNYPCDKLTEFFNFGGKLVNSDARKQLDAIRKTL